MCDYIDYPFQVVFVHFLNVRARTLRDTTRLARTSSVRDVQKKTVFRTAASSSRPLNNGVLCRNKQTRDEYTVRPEGRYAHFTKPQRARVYPLHANVTAAKLSTMSRVCQSTRISFISVERENGRTSGNGGRAEWV